MQISIIIPTLNEAENIGRLVTRLIHGSENKINEVIVVDGGSTDATRALAEKAGATVLLSPKKGRAAQMNFGARYATGELLYFVHGDTLPPECYMPRIQKAVKEGYPMGCFWFEFDSPRWWFKIHNWLTHFDMISFRGGDQSLFVTRKIYDEMKGYKDDFLIMEEYDFIIRARKKYTFKIIPKPVIVSARKYDTNNYFRVQLANVVVFNMFFLGFSQKQLANTYKRLLNYR